jgi:hypothetical protein
MVRRSGCSERGHAVRRAAAVSGIVRRKAGRAWGLGSVIAFLIILGLALLGEGAPGDLDRTFGVGAR